MQKPRRVRPVTLICAFALMTVLLCGMVFAALHHGNKVRFGLVPSAQAFGAAHLLQTSSSQYTCTMYEEEEVILRALDNNLLDAALISAQSAVSLPADLYEIRGVFSVTDLLVLSEDETVLNMGALSGRTLILPAALEFSRESNLLQLLLKDCGCAGYDVIYSTNPAAAYQQIPGSVLLLPMDELESTLRAAPSLRVRFRLSAQWRTQYQTVPPAGLVIVCRRDVLGTGTCLSFEKALRDSMTYADRKRKKTIAMAVAAGLFDDESAAGQLIDHMSFTYHEGEDMRSSLQAWKMLY